MDPRVMSDGTVANDRIPKTMGILNIIFAAGLMICGLCTLFSAAMYPMWVAAMGKLEGDMIAKENAQRKTAIEAIEAEEKEAETDEQKLELAKRRKAIEDRPRLSQVFKVDFKSAGLEDSRLVAYLWIEFLTGLVLNLLMLSAGIGLVMQRTWGLKLGMWTAGLKIVRLMLVYGYMAFVIAPIMAQAMGKLAVQSISQQQKAMGANTPPPGFTGETFTRMYAVGMTAYAATYIVVGAIYPAISLWLLSRPAAWAACSESRKAQGTAEPW